MEKTEIEKTIIETCIHIGRRGEGALIILGEAKYKPLVNQDVPPFNITKNPKLLESLALMDGAVVIKLDGTMQAYGVRVNSTSVLPNFGTRHSAALSASMNRGTVVYLVSEEEKKIKVFKAGSQILQIDVLQKNVEKHVPKIIGFLESVGFGTVSSVGTSMLIPTPGIAFLPGVLVFGGAYWIINLIKEWTKIK